MKDDAFRKTAVVAGGLALGAGLGTLTGWAIGSDLLKSFVPGTVPMNPLTAIAFVLCGASLIVAVVQPGAGWVRRCCQIATASVATSAAVVLAGYLGHWDVGIDRLLFTRLLGDNRMAPNTAAGMILLGTALFALLQANWRWQWVSRGPAIVVALGSLLSLLGYAFGVTRMYGIASFVPMAVNTAAAFLGLSLGILAATPRSMLMGLLGGPGAGAMMARRLVPAALTIPIMLSWLRLIAEKARWCDAEVGISLHVWLTIVLMLAAVWWTSKLLNDLDVDRHRAWDELKQSRDALVDSVQDYAIIMLDTQGRIASWNVGAARITGYQADEIVGRNSACLFTPEERESGKPDQELKQAVASGRVEDEGWRVRKDGSRYWANVIISALRDERGQLLGFAKVSRDITDKRDTQQKIDQLNVALQGQVQQLGAINRELEEKHRENEMFVYSVSHDLRSPLVNLQGFSRELAVAANELRAILQDERVPLELRDHGRTLLEQDMTQFLGFIQSAVKRLSNIIDALLRLSRVGRIEYRLEPLDCINLVNRVVESFAGTISNRDAQVLIRDLPSPYADNTAVEVIFANLLGNALNYLDQQRPGVIEIGCAAETAGREIHNGSFLTYYVRDNGLGIALAHQAKIFQAFQRAHPEVAPGEGMGLAIVRRIVERHGGEVWVDSTVGVGSTFYFTLPAAMPGAARSSSDAAITFTLGDEHGSSQLIGNVASGG